MKKNIDILNCEVITQVDFNPEKEGQEAGLTVISDTRHHYEILVTRLNGQRQIIVRRRIGSLISIVSESLLEKGLVKLRIMAEPLNYSFYYALENEPMELLAKGETRYLAAEAAGGFTGVYFGIYSTGNGKPCDPSAYFNWFDYRVL